MSRTVLTSAVVALAVTCLTLGAAYLLHWASLEDAGTMVIHRAPDPLVQKGLLRVSGQVARPGDYRLRDLADLPQTTLRVKEAHPLEYRGLFVYTGVPLRVLLEDAGIGKQGEPEFPRDVDLVIRAVGGRGRDGRGREVRLSYGEVFYTAVEDRILVATSQAHVIPGHHPEGRSAACADCHRDEKERWHDCTLCHDGQERPELRPRESITLICGSDRWTLRNLEDLRELVVEPPPLALPPFQRGSEAEPSRELALLGPEGRTLGWETLDRAVRIEREEVLAGHGKGLQGRARFTGTPLTELIPTWREVPDPAGTILVAVATDHYRTVFSWSEVFNSRAGADLQIVTRKDGDPLPDREGLLKLMAYGDLFADRSVKSIQTIHLLQPEGAAREGGPPPGP